MNTRNAICAMAAVLIWGGAVSAREERPFIGVRLDPAPLPELLAKHLGLKPGQGIRIRNVNIPSPAEAVGLERDDIIIGFQGQEVMDLDRFVESVRAAGVDTSVALEIVHLGQCRTLEFALAPFAGQSKWKYPPEPEVVTSWRPGKVFRVEPDGDDWVEIQVDDMPDISTEVKRFFRQRHVYHHSTDGEDYTISVEGDPQDENARVTVHAEDAEHSTTVGQLDALPEKYREPAREAIDAAKQSARGRFHFDNFVLPRPPRPETYRRYFQNIVPESRVEVWSQKRDDVLKKLETQMERLQQRMEELEQEHQETLEKLLEKMKDHSGDDDEDGTGSAAHPAAPTTSTI